MGAAVTARRYPGLPHTINFDELEEARVLLQAVVQGAEGPEAPDGPA